MTIRAKLHLVIYVILIFTIIIGVLLFWTSKNINTAVARLTEDHKIVSSTLKLKIYLEEYMDYLEERPLAQWQNEYRHLGTLLSQRRESTDPQVFADLKRGFEKVGTLYDRLIASHRSRSQPHDNERFTILTYHLEQIADLISQLHEETASAILTLQRHATTVISVFGLGSLSIILVSLLEAVAKPLIRVKRAKSRTI